MLIKDISLTNFRNHSSYHLDFKPDTTLILGANGCGKTSVLEAIYMLTRGKSFRATDPDIIKRNTDFYRIELNYQNGEQIVATYDGVTKLYKTKDKASHRLSAKNKYPVILFEPHDLNLVSGPPARRRDYFDQLFSDFSEEYATAINKYKKAIRQRNELLKSETIRKDTLYSWNLLLATFGSFLNLARKTYFSGLNQSLNPTYHSIAENSDTISITYRPVAENLTKETYLHYLDESFEKDKILGFTSFGIHRDAVDFIFNNQPADGSASRGETRSIILALKFVEANTTTAKFGKKPLILLDDVFSELDFTRRRALIDNFKDNQVVITSVEDVLN